MYISLAGTWLTNPNNGTSERVVTSSRSLKIDGKIVVQTDLGLRAVSETFIARGNLSHVITFKVTRRFTTIAAAFAFAAQYRSSLPTSGALVMVSGWGGETQQFSISPNAVLEDCNYDSDDTPGVSVTHAYTLRCGAIAAVAGTVITDEGSSTPVTDEGSSTPLTD